jgi:hypothetical protein
MINTINTLSDVELVTITNELTNKSISLDNIVLQLEHKANGPFIKPNNKWELVEVVLKEWIKRFKNE